MKIYARTSTNTISNTFVGHDLWFYSEIDMRWYMLTDEASSYYKGYKYAGRRDMREWMTTRPMEYRVTQKEISMLSPRYFNKYEYDPVFKAALQSKEFLTTAELFGLDEDAE